MKGYYVKILWFLSRVKGHFDLNDGSAQRDLFKAIHPLQFRVTAKCDQRKQNGCYDMVRH